MALSVNREKAELIRRRVEASQEMRPFPDSLSRLLASLQDANSTARTFAKIIECDAALAARLLRMTNSPLYGLRNEVKSIEHACSMLGRRPLKTLALSLAGASMFSDPGPAREERAALWRHSLGCASTARLLAKVSSSVSPDDAFLAGIFHDVGKLVFHDVVPADYRRISLSDCGIRLVERERTEFAVTHTETGLRSALAWNLPEEVKVAIGYHHSPEDAPNHSRLAAMTNLADALSRTWGIGCNGGRDLPVSAQLLEDFRVDQGLLPDLIDLARETYQETLRACA